MTESFGKKQGIYIDLDALLDTRLGTIFSYGEEIMFKVLANDYNKREIDSFVGIDREDFKLKYKNRDKVTLKNSMVSKVANIVKEMVLTMSKQAITSPFHTGPKIYLNVYPYVMDDEEKDIILGAVTTMTGKLADIEIIDEDNTKITPAYIKENIAVMFKYSYGEWFDAQARNFEKLPCPEIGVFVPAIYFDRQPTAEELKQIIEESKHPFKGIELASSPMIGLKLIDIDYYCASIK